MNLKDKTKRDERINAPLISWKAYLVIVAIVYLLLVTQAIIIYSWMGEMLTFVMVMIYYLALTCLLLAVIYSLVNRFLVGNPVQRIAAAARKITLGDYSVRVEHIRKDGKRDEIEVLIEDFNKMAQELGSTEIFKNDFVANVSHEIKTPLSVINSYSKALKDLDMTVAEREQYINTILDASKKLNTMISNILKLNKLENQGISVKANNYQLGEQLRKCVLAFMNRQDTKVIDFQIDVVDVCVAYDAQLLELVWNNLLSNAVKFTEDGGTICVVSVCKDNKVFVEIQDSGCGIPKEMQKRIFDKFYQVDTSHSTQGNGLGLALVKRVLDMINADIFVISEEGKGTKFSVALESDFKSIY